MSSHPGRSPISRLRSGLHHAVLYVSLSWRESTDIVNLNSDEETLFVPTYRPGVGPLPSECCVSVERLTLTFQMPVFNLIPGPRQRLAYRRKGPLRRGRPEDVSAHWHPLPLLTLLLFTPLAKEGWMGS